MLLLLLIVGVRETQATVGIKSLGYKTDFASTSEPFDKGDIVNTNTSIGSVLRVFNTTSRAYFNDTHTLRTNETVTVSFTAYHGYLNINSTSSVSIINTDGVVLVGYTYNHSTGRVTDVKIGGSTVAGFTEFDGISYTGDKNANGIEGNGKPYVAGSSTNNPRITMLISENGTTVFNLYLSNKSINQTYWGNIGSAAKNLRYIEITSDCSNSDRTICIDDLEITTNYYSQNYESGTIDWTTSVNGRFDPIILEEYGNHFLAGDPTKTDQNGATLTGPKLNVSSGTQYELSFDLRIAKANTDSPEFYYNNSNGNKFFSIVQDGASGIRWIINNSVYVDLPNSNYVSASNSFNDRPWYHFKITWKNNTCKLSITNYWGNETYLSETTITPLSETDGIDRLMFGTGRYYAKFSIDNVEVTPLPTWSASNATVNITDVGATDPNVVADYLPYLKEHRYDISYYSSNSNVASFWPGDQLLIKGIGTTTITATDTQGNSASYNLTVTGTTVAPVISGNTLTFSEPGIIVNNTDRTTKSHTLPKGLTVSYGYNNENIGETAIVINSENGPVLKVIDSNGYSRPNLGGNGVPYEGIYGGTFVKLEATANGYMVLTGNVSSTKSRLYKSDGTAIETDINESEHTLAALLTSGSTYYLYNLRTIDDATNGVILPLVNSITYVDARFDKYYEVITIPANGQYTIQQAHGMSNPTYTIESTGEVGSPTVNGNTINGITGGGAIKITATSGSSSIYYYLTVAYPATDYPGHLWNFCTDVDNEDNEVRRELDISPNLKTAPAAGTTTYDSYGEEWRFEYKSGNRSPRWYKMKAVNGDNAFVVKETKGLVFVTDEHNFYLRNDDGEFSHIGIRGNEASFTVPALEAGDIVEVMWRHETSASGTVFTATNVTDLRGKDVNDEFLITESARRGNSNTRFVGYYSFIAKGGNVTFTLKDAGNCDIQSIRIYKGPYNPTMRDINLSGNNAAPTTMLLDNAQQGYTYNYCNQLYSTSTGPAMYVLKGYRKNNGGTLGVDYDHEGCVTGSNAAKTPAFFTDEDAYPVSDAEKARLYELRKNIIGFQMYNETWPSSNNSYNNGVIKATSGWGKVTIRLNNYTNDMKYVIGYTPDYTLTIGSAPHQTYPYTWDFTKIAGGKVTGRSDNVLYSIEAEGSDSKFSGAAPTNWLKNGNGQFILNTDNSGDLGSQYVPGAVLVTQDRALSNFRGVDYDNKWAKDELDGLGFDGDITMHIDNLPSDVASGWNRSATNEQWNSLLSFKITDYATFEQTGGTEEEPIGAWHYSLEEQDAGNGRIKLNHEDGNNHIDESYIPSGGIGFRLDGGETKYIHVIPESPLQVGDVIYVTAYNAYGSRDAGISFNKSASSSDVAQYKMLSNRLVEETLTYTVTTNDGLDKKEDFYLFRNANTVHITAIEISRKASTIPNLDWSIYTLTETTITVPDLNADGKQDWIYVSASAEPISITNATKVTEGTDGLDAKSNIYKYKVSGAGESKITFDIGTKIYKIGVTHILKEIHPVGSTGWATEIRNHGIDHELIGYFTKNDVNAYTVKYDSYDMNTATVALTPINEDGYVPEKTGIVMRLDNISSLADANNGKNVPLFYPSYTRAATSTAVDFPANNLMYNVNEGIDNDNRNYNEEIFNYNGTNVNYTKFILTNNYWTFDKNHALNTDEAATSHTADAAGFYRMHIWKTTGDVATKNTMPAHTAYLLVPSNNLPAAVWTLQSGYSAARGNLLGVYNIISPDSETAIDDIKMTPEAMMNGNDTDGNETWYTVSGMKLSSRPTLPGLYLCNGRKVIVRKEQ